MSEVTIGILEEVPGTGYNIRGILENRIDVGPIGADFISYENSCPPDAKQGYKIIPGQTIKLGKKNVILVRINMVIAKAHFIID